MDRKRFLQGLGLLSISAASMKLFDLYKLTAPLSDTGLMPALFLGHGSPMNAIQETEFTKTWKEIGKSLPKPRAIICVSAHWETRGTFITAMEKPKTIHDFGGFPDELYAVQYPAPGSPSIANETKQIIKTTQLGLDTDQWGLDHGCWSVIKHLYPNADIPVLQLSLDYTKDPSYHYALAKELSALRRKGILIIGSGNMVHNLGVIDWRNQDRGYDWAVEANETFKKLILNNNHTELIHYKKLGKAIDLSVPSPEHYLPLLYVLALQEKDETPIMYNDKTIMGSISMTSLKIA